MSIRSIGTPYGPQRPAAPSAPVGPAGASSAAPAAKPDAVAPAGGSATRRDSVAISDAGRALAGGPEAAGASASGGLTEARVADLRRKVLEGAYDQTHVVDQVAKRLLSSGDV